MSIDPRESGGPGPDPLSRLDDPDYPALTMSQAAQLLGVQAAFLRSLDTSGVLHPHRSSGGHRRYSRRQLQLAARVRGLLDDGHLLSSAQLIVQLQDDLAGAQADAETARDERDAARGERDAARGERDAARREPDPTTDR
jgi:MerR family transcriptional regulator, heat shock protein HspR